MSLKPLNKRKKSRSLGNATKKSRSLGNATKKTKKHMRKYVGRGKFVNGNEYLFNANSELSNLRGPDAALRHLKVLQQKYPTDNDLRVLIDDLEESGKLLEESRINLADLIRLNDDSN